MQRTIGVLLFVSVLSFVVGRMTAPTDKDALYVIKGISTNVPITVNDGAAGSITNSRLFSGDGKPPYICLGSYPCDQSESMVIGQPTP